MNQGDLKRISPYLYEIPKTHRHDMRVPARFYADAELLQAALGDKSLDQLVNSATLPGIVGYALAMPDIHQGYGFPIGGVVATQTPDGVISPAASATTSTVACACWARASAARRSLPTSTSWRRNCNATAPTVSAAAASSS
jgi:hypothetical protein